MLSGNHVYKHDPNCGHAYETWDPDNGRTGVEGSCYECGNPAQHQGTQRADKVVTIPDYQSLYFEAQTKVVLYREDLLEIVEDAETLDEAKAMARKALEYKR